MKRITNEQREAIVRRAVAERDALQGWPELISFVHHALERLVRLHDEHLTAEPPLEERSDEEYSRWAYAMSDAWDDARAALKEESRKLPAKIKDRSS